MIVIVGGREEREEGLRVVGKARRVFRVVVASRESPQLYVEASRPACVGAGTELLCAAGTSRATASRHRMGTAFESASDKRKIKIKK